MVSKDQELCLRNSTGCRLEFSQTQCMRICHSTPRISISLIPPYLDIYQSRGYAIWPVVDTESLLARLITYQDDMEAYALATSLCAATVTQFQIDEDESLVAGYCQASSRLFKAETKRARPIYDYQERMTT